MFNLRTASLKPDVIQEARQALNESFRQYKSIGAIAADPQFVHKSAVLIRELARTIWAGTDATPLLFNRKAGPGLGNWVEIEEIVNTAMVVRRSLGGKPKTFTPHKRKYTFDLQDYRVDFALELEAVLTGQMDASVLVDHMGDAIARHYESAAVGAIDAACQIGTLDQYGLPVRTNIGTVLTDTALDTALKRLGDANPDVTIAGRFSALFPMLGFSGYSDAALEEIRNLGAIGRYKGAQVVVLKDRYNPFFRASTIPANRIYLVGGEKGGDFVEEDMSMLDYETIDQEEQHMRLGTKLRATFFVHKPWKYHVVQTP
jgi:hypothetical protein